MQQLCSPFDQRTVISDHCATSIQTVAKLLTFIIEGELGLCQPQEHHSLLPTRMNVLCRLVTLWVQPMGLQGTHTHTCTDDATLVMYPQAATTTGQLGNHAYW